jgi:outer membrane receptor protein involved in Fe transport
MTFIRTFRFAVLTLSCLLTVSCSLMAQNATVYGKIITGEAGTPLAGVTVSSGTKWGTNSAADGTYRLELPAGNHELQFRMLSFATTTQKITLGAGETKMVNINMKDESKLLNTVVISASKFEQRIEEVTVSMEVLKPYLVQNTNATSADQALDQIPGVSIVDGQANIRGGSGWSYGAGSRVQVMVDDMPLLAADAGDAKWSFIPIENMEQAEIIKGASSVLYGSSALNGTINFRTGYPKEKPVTKVTMFQGVYDRCRQTLNDTTYTLDYWNTAPPVNGGFNFFHSQKFEHLDLVTGGNVFYDQGYREGDWEKRERFNANLRYRIPKVDGLSVGVNGNIMHSEGSNYFLWLNCKDGAFKPAPNTTSEYTTLRATVDPYITYVTSSGNSHKFKSRYFLTDNNTNSNQSSRAATHYFEYQYQHHFNGNLTATGGGVYNINNITSDLYLNHKGTNAAIYLQGDFKWKKLNLSGGARAEKYTIDDRNEKWTPVIRLGANYQLTEGTFLRGSFGQGYRFPTVAELFVKTNVGQLNVYPDSLLRSETGWSTELGIMQGFKLGEWKGIVDVAFFQNDYKNMMEFTFAQWGPPTDPFYGFGFSSINIGNTRIRGIETSVAGAGEICSGYTLRVLGGYTFLDPRLLSYDSTWNSKIGDGNILGSDSSNFLKYRFRHTAKFDVELSRKKWMVGMSMRYTSFMVNIDKIFASPIFELAFPGFGVDYYRAHHHHGDVVFDFRSSYQITPEVKAFFIVKNVMNNIYMQRPADMQAPRQFVLQVSLEF